MKKLEPRVRSELLGTPHFRPAVSIILPFEPKMCSKAAIERSIQAAVTEVKQELTLNYPDDIAGLMLMKIQKLVRSLNYSTHKKSVALFISPFFEKILYLEIPVEKKVIIDESFEIRDLVYSKKALHKYLVLTLCNHTNQIYLGNGSTFIRILNNSPERKVFSAIHPNAFPGSDSGKDAFEAVLLEKHLHDVDQSLSLILNAYRLPLFVLGSERVLKQFKQLTHHNHAVVEYVYHNWAGNDTQALRRQLQPHLANWQKVIQTDLLHQLEDAAGKGKLACGIQEVWREANAHRGRLLIVEKNYMMPAQQNINKAALLPIESAASNFSYIRDAVDDVMEKVLENGGDVEFVAEGLLAGHQKIALIF